MVGPFRGRSLDNALAGLPRQTVLVDVSAPRAVRGLVVGGSWWELRWVLAACALHVALFAQGDAEGRRYDIDIRDADAPAEYILPSDMTGNQLPLQPNHKFALTASYETPLTGIVGGNLQLLGTYSWVDERASDLSNFDISTMPAYGRFDVRSTWTSPDETITAALFVQNVFDEIGVIEYLHLSSHWTPRQGTLTDPRTVGLEFRWRPDL